MPLIVTGAGVPAGAVTDTPVSLLDIPQTIIEAVGEETDRRRTQGNCRVTLLIGIANGERPDRAILSEYHAVAATTGIFMIRYENWKYVHFVGHPPQLFDLKADPLEANDLGRDPAYGNVRSMLEGKLRAICDPEAYPSRRSANRRKRSSATADRRRPQARGVPCTPPPPARPRSWGV